MPGLAVRKPQAVRMPSMAAHEALPGGFGGQLLLPSERSSVTRYMPSKSKHVPTYKSLISSNRPGELKQSNKQSRSVNDLISRSRSDRVARASNNTGLSREANAWSQTSGTTESHPLLGNHAVHPAEIVRQQALAKREASRRVSGPAPPPSWNASRFQLVHPSPPSTPIQVPERSAAELYLIRNLWCTHVTHSDNIHPWNRRGVGSLVETTMLSILDWMTEDGREAGDGGMREAVTWLDLQMRQRLMSVAGQHGRGWTISELRAICATPVDDWDDMDGESSVVESEEDWDVGDSTEFQTFTFLDFTATRYAHRVVSSLFKSPSIAIKTLTLSSINLSCTSLDLSALVPVLPPGLRHLSLADVTFLDKVTERQWRMLGQRLQVLTFLDLSFTPLSALYLSFLLNPPTIKLPSLRQFGIQGWSSSSHRAIIPSNDKLDPALKSIIRNPERKKWIEVLDDLLI